MPWNILVAVLNYLCNWIHEPLAMRKGKPTTRGMESIVQERKRSSSSMCQLKREKREDRERKRKEWVLTIAWLVLTFYQPLINLQQDTNSRALGFTDCFLRERFIFICFLVVRIYARSMTHMLAFQSPFTEPRNVYSDGDGVPNLHWRHNTRANGRQFVSCLRGILQVALLLACFV